jgi:hypothetical protein
MMISSVRASSFRVGSRASWLFDEFEIVGDRIEIRSGLIYLTQRERAFVSYARDCQMVVTQSLGSHRQEASTNLGIDAK